MTCTLPPREAQEHFGILIWTFAILMHPELILDSPVEVTCFEFNAAQPNIVAGGCCNGQIIVWDYSRVSFEKNHKLTALGPGPEKSVSQSNVDVCLVQLLKLSCIACIH